MDLQECFEKASGAAGIGKVTARYGRFSDLKHVWRSDSTGMHFVVSDYMEGSPDDIMMSLADYLVAKSRTGSVKKQKAAKYLEYVNSKEFWARNRDAFLSRSRNLILEPVGRNHDLGIVFDYVNSNYFNLRLSVPTLAWSTESPRIRVGCYFDALELLAVNKALDSDRVPRYVLEFVMYHELLHYVDSLSGLPFRRVRHSKEFRELESRFSSHKDAEDWLARIVKRHISPRR